MRVAVEIGVGVALFGVMFAAALTRAPQRFRSSRLFPVFFVVHLIEAGALIALLLTASLIALGVTVLCVGGSYVVTCLIAVQARE